ncbi:hypothetical protein AVEN_89163-1 [Araneus ventricosus]|uniref:Uncharacterized protein n=1 Tax=Araneus ventricosus TaxID=182803 RepID=A0A4Y2B2S8_ARAVE|nr:hypothetical protein AVEN_89163-1 [Araneus ventricosus]
MSSLYQMKHWKRSLFAVMRLDGKRAIHSEMEFKLISLKAILFRSKKKLVMDLNSSHVTKCLTNGASLPNFYYTITWGYFGHNHQLYNEHDKRYEIRTMLRFFP